MVVRLLIVCCVSLVAGCQTLVYEPVTYDGVVQHQSALPFRMSVETTPGEAAEVTVSGDASYTADDGTYIPNFYSYETLPREDYWFGEKDQIAFANNLSDELIRLGVLGNRVEDDTAQSLLLQLVFTKSFYDLERDDAYQFLGSLAVEFDAKKSTCPFNIDSYEAYNFIEDTFWTPTDAAQRRASQMLMDELFICVENFVGELDLEPALGPTLESEAVS